MTFKIDSTLAASLPGLVLGFWWIVSPQSYLGLMLRYRLTYNFIPWPGIATLALVSLYYYAAYYDLSRR